MGFREMTIHTFGDKYGTSYCESYEDNSGRGDLRFNYYVNSNKIYGNTSYYKSYEKGHKCWRERLFLKRSIVNPVVCMGHDVFSLAKVLLDANYKFYKYER